MSEKFAPGVMINGYRYEPRGYEWILGFALGGCQWAIDAANKPGFHEMVVRGEATKKAAVKMRQIRTRLEEIEKLKIEVDNLLDRDNLKNKVEQTIERVLPDNKEKP